MGIEQMTDDYKQQFEEIYTEYYTRLYFFALHIVGEEEVAKDLLNDVFTSLWKCFMTIDKSNIHSYLFTSIRNRAVDYLRRNIQKKKYSDEYIREASVYYSEYSDENERMVEEMMHQLQPPTDVILRMCYLEGMKYTEVAEKMGISKSTVKKHIMKALRTLRELYGSKDARNRLSDVVSI